MFFSISRDRAARSDPIIEDPVCWRLGHAESADQSGVRYDGFLPMDPCRCGRKSTAVEKDDIGWQTFDRDGAGINRARTHRDSGRHSARADTIRIGLMLPYSGINADLGDLRTRRSNLSQAARRYGRCPHKIEMIKHDEGPASGAQAKAVATELITRDKVQMIAGVVFSPSAIAMAPVMTQAKVPLLIGNAGTAWLAGSHALHRAAVIHHVVNRLSPGQLRVQSSGAARLPSWALRIIRQEEIRSRRSKTSFEMAGGKSWIRSNGRSAPECRISKLS